MTTACLNGRATLRWMQAWLYTETGDLNSTGGNQGAFPGDTHPIRIFEGYTLHEPGWNPEYEKAVEIHSIWGSSECHADDGNMQPILTNKGEMRGRHVRDALDKGYRLGFVGGGDIHDGRPGLPLANDNYLKLARQR